MKYLVMEIHPAYAVLLDEEGCFLKAANLRYQVGDTVRDIVELNAPEGKRRTLGRPLAGLAAMAACLCLVFFGYYSPNYTAYGTLRIQINPDVEMTISRTERVLELEGLNQDGEALLEGYSYQGKSRDTATGELVERAIEMGYLSDGDTISITVSSRDADWQTKEEQQVRRQLEDRYGESVVIRLLSGEVEGGAVEPSPVPDGDVEVLIPVVPAPSAPASSPTPRPDGMSQHYGETDYESGGGSDTDYGDRDHGPGSDDDRNDTDYGPYADGDTDYEERSDESDEDRDDEDQEAPEGEDSTDDDDETDDGDDDDGSDDDDYDDEADDDDGGD